MPDKYSNFAELAAHETEGVHYRIRLVQRMSQTVLIAPHGGCIEPGTSEVAGAVANGSLSLYCFEGLECGRPHGDLHITSVRFDEPKGRRLVEASEVAVAIHGRADEGDGQTVWLGGLHERLRDAMGEALDRSGFATKATGHRLPGREKGNICNLGRRKAGAQLELPRTLRDALIADTHRLDLFAAVVRDAIERQAGTSRQASSRGALTLGASQFD